MLVLHMKVMTVILSPFAVKVLLTYAVTRPHGKGRGRLTVLLMFGAAVPLNANV